VNFYPVEEARNSNMRHRPIGIGVQGTVLLSLLSLSLSRSHTRHMRTLGLGPS